MAHVLYLHFSAPNNKLNAKIFRGYIWYTYSYPFIGGVGYDFDYELGLCVRVCGEDWFDEMQRHVIEIHVSLLLNHVWRRNVVCVYVKGDCFDEMKRCVAWNMCRGSECEVLSVMWLEIPGGPKKKRSEL